MQKWIAFVLSGALTVAFVIGLFIQPVDSEANSTSYWKVDFYNNTELEGTPVYSRTDQQVSFNWAEESPAPGVAADGFAARWQGSFEFEAGAWNFTVGADDGVRLWVNDTLLIDNWTQSEGYAVHTATINLDSGLQELRLEYYDAGEFAGVNLNWELAPATIDDGGDDDGTVSQMAPDTNPATAQEDEDPPIANVATGVLNVREGAGIQYRRVTQIFLYQRYRIEGQNPAGTWYQIDIGGGELGWVSSFYVLVTGTGDIPIVEPPVEEDGEENAFTSTPGFTLYRLNLRAEASSSSPIVGIIPYDVTVEVEYRDATSIWYLITYEDLTGYVFAPYVALVDTPVYDIPFE